MAFQSSALFLLFLIALPLLSHAEIPYEVVKEIKLINSRDRITLSWLPVKQNSKQFFYSECSALACSRYLCSKVLRGRSILAMSGNGSVNAAQTTQLLLTHFRVKGVIHYGRAASVNHNSLRIGDVAIPEQFAHIGVWYWEKFGGDEKSYTRKIANLTFSEYNVEEGRVKNRMQSVYFQRETVYSKPEDGKSNFWFNVDAKLYATAKRIKLDRCVQLSMRCLAEQPEIRRVERGGRRGNIYVNNEAFKDFLHNKLRIASIDTESAAIAMVCASEKKAFLAMRSVTNNGGGSSSAGNHDAIVIKLLWHFHAAEAIKAFFKELASEAYSNLRSVTGGEIW